MEKEFIPYEEALALKELGFDEKIFGLYGKTGGELFIVNDNKFDEVDKIHFIKAPTYSQAFRWFREKYGLGHMINGIGHESFIMNVGGIIHAFNAFEFKTYEEAELACLKKLIELVTDEKQK